MSKEYELYNIPVNRINTRNFLVNTIHNYIICEFQVNSNLPTLFCTRKSIIL